MWNCHYTTVFQVMNTKWTNVNLLCFPDNTEIACLEGLTLCCSEINQSKQSFVNHGNCTAMCSVTIEKTGKQVDLGLFVVISALCLPFYGWKFPGIFLGFHLLVLWSSFVKTPTFYGNTDKTRQKLGISFLLTCLHFTRWFTYYCQRSNWMELVNQFQ